MKIVQWLEEKFMQQPEFFLVEVKVQGRKITVYLDGDHGITIDKCGEFSRWLERHLDGEMLMGSDYILEVSSPGIDNPLKMPRQYKNAIGKEVTVIKYDGSRIDGVLNQAEEKWVKILASRREKGKREETITYEIPLTEIKSTKLKINF